MLKPPVALPRAFALRLYRVVQENEMSGRGRKICQRSSWSAIGSEKDQTSRRLDDLWADTGYSACGTQAWARSCGACARVPPWRQSFARARVRAVMRSGSWRTREPSRGL